MGINCVSQSVSEIYGNRKFWRFDAVYELEFEVKKLEDVHQTVAQQLLLFQSLFYLINPSLNFLKVHLHVYPALEIRGRLLKYEKSEDF